MGARLVPPADPQRDPWDKPWPKPLDPRTSAWHKPLARDATRLTGRKFFPDEVPDAASLRLARVLAAAPCLEAGAALSHVLLQFLGPAYPQLEISDSARACRRLFGAPPTETTAEPWQRRISALWGARLLEFWETCPVQVSHDPPIAKKRAFVLKFCNRCRLRCTVGAAAVARKQTLARCPKDPQSYSIFDRQTFVDIRVALASAFDNGMSVMPLFVRADHGRPVLWLCSKPQAETTERPLEGEVIELEFDEIAIIPPPGRAIADLAV